MSAKRTEGEKKAFMNFYIIIAFKICKNVGKLYKNS